MFKIHRITGTILWVPILLAVTCFSYADVIEEPPVFLRQWGTPAPWGSAADISGNVFAVDPVNKLIRKFDTTGIPLYEWTNCGDVNPAQCYSPWDIALDSHSNVYVANQDGMAKFDHNGNLLMKFGSWSAIVTGLAVYTPPDSSFDSTEYVYVTNLTYHTVQKYTSDGDFVTQWGGPGSQPGKFRWPYDLATDSVGNVYVADTFNHRIQKFDPDGNFLFEWPTQTVTGLAIDPSDNIYAVSASNNCIQKFNSTGVPIAQWGESGTEEGKFASPFRVNVSAHGLIYVSDTGNNRIQVFGSAFADSDGDGREDSEDNCVDAFNPAQEDTDQDGAGDACDICPHDSNDDMDGDGICGDVDNCPEIGNIDQSDIDGDGIGDLCDSCDNRPVTGITFPSPNILWPPDHRMIPVNLDMAGLALNNGSTIIQIESVEVIELNIKGKNIYSKNDFEPDFEITGPLSLNLRSERSGNSMGRLYAITVTVEDCSGQSRFTVEVVVPHDKGR